MRANVLVLILSSFLFSTNLYADTTLAARVNIFKDIAEALVTAGDAIKSITDGVAHLIVTGAKGYDKVAAASERKRMLDISARASNLVTNQNVIVVRSIDEYLSKPKPTFSDWEAVRSTAPVPPTKCWICAIPKNWQIMRSGCLFTSCPATAD